MSDNERDELARIVHASTYDVPLPDIEEADMYELDAYRGADAVLASDWLVSRDRRMKAEGWDEGAKWMTESEYGEPFTNEDRSRNPYQRTETP